MKKVKKFFKLMLLFAMIPIADPKTFGIFLFLPILLLILMALPLIMAGLLIGLGLQLSNYVVFLWGHSGNDTKLAVIVAVVLAAIPTIAVMPVVIGMFRKFREFAWEQLEKNNIHHRKDIKNSAQLPLPNKKR